MGNALKVVETQLRLQIGPYRAIPAGGRHWALPGGRRVTQVEALRLARENGWPRPAFVRVTVRHALDVAVSRETRDDGGAA